jgi:glucose-6-phosphate 1-dehydrogenase
VSFDAEEVRDMKAQVLRALRPMVADDVQRSCVRGQYEGYLEEPGVEPQSRTPTYSALRVHVDNWRWQGVPFYLRAGKGLSGRSTTISLHFRTIPFCLFGEQEVCQRIDPNVLRLRIQPDEGISLRFASKAPGEGVEIGSVLMDFRYADAFERSAPDAYERLLLDCMRGDATLFARRDEVELSWRFVQPILDAWQADAERVAVYLRGSEGPAQAADLMRADGRHWERLP